MYNRHVHWNEAAASDRRLIFLGEGGRVLLCLLHQLKHLLLLLRKLTICMRERERESI